MRVLKQKTPDLLLVGLNLPDSAPEEVVKRCAGVSQHTRIAVLADAEEPQLLLRSLQAGAVAIVRKSWRNELLRSVVAGVVRGKVWVDPEYFSKFIAGLSRPEPANKFRLTARELQIITKVAAGGSNKDIARDCDLSVQTVKHHLRHIFDKVGVSTRLELALFAIHHHLDQLPETLT
jgi:DNA-binding NarL/FixJ family response regulator